MKARDQNPKNSSNCAVFKVRERQFGALRGDTAINWFKDINSSLSVDLFVVPQFKGTFIYSLGSWKIGRISRQKESLHSL